MISKETFSIEHIYKLQGEYQRDPSLLERVLFAFGLLEAIARTGMPFVFKGGTSLMLLTGRPLRLSTDIDIFVTPGTDVDQYISEASKLFPFLSYSADCRTGKNRIEKRHFKFVYYSPLRKENFYILLDIVFAENQYESTGLHEIKNNLLITESIPVMVRVPAPECILADKLTAFAPHTTGIPFGIGKELEIIKQLFDVAILSEKIERYQDAALTYDRVVVDEIGYRDLRITRDDVLLDTIQACSCIIGKGAYNPDEFPLFMLAGNTRDFNRGMRGKSFFDESDNLSDSFPFCTSSY